MQNLSSYILTFNNEETIADVLRPLLEVADEVVVLDSGSVDRTRSIVEAHPEVRWLERPLDDFASHRNYAAAQCSHDWVLFIDSDEVLDDEAVSSIRRLKEEGFDHDAFRITRRWTVLGRSVSAIYPVQSPDHPIRLIDRRRVSFSSESNLVHESPFGYRTLGLIQGTLSHTTFVSQDELWRKLEHYTNLAARDLLRRKKSLALWKRLINPVASWIKWYLIKGSWRDGYVGWVMGLYAYRYNRLKYAKAVELQRGKSDSR